MEFREKISIGGKAKFSRRKIFKNRPFLCVRKPNGSVIEMDRDGAVAFLESLDALGSDCSIHCQNLRENIRKSLTL
jgi:hypothetical protein